jgi:hypothetical protein
VHADYRLAAGMHMDVLHRGLLLALAAMTIERVEQYRIRAREPACPAADWSRSSLSDPLAAPYTNPGVVLPRGDYW